MKKIKGFTLAGTVGCNFLHQSKAFTLAEMLIALVVIGIIAAITLTTVMPNIQERVNSQRQANIVYKVTQATNLMKANGAMINGFESTDAFVDELQKYLKIMKRCDSEHIADCWPTKKVRTSDGKEFEVSKAKTRNQLGFEDNYKDNQNVGIVLADGATLIMTYNPGASGITIGDVITSFTTELPSGGRFQTFLDYTSNTTGGIAFVMDVNGSKGPNSETINNKLYDIRNFNGAHFSKGCAGQSIGGTCYIKINSWSNLNCSHSSGITPDTLLYPENAAYCGEESQDSNDVWAGAKKVCENLEMRLPTQTELVNICTSHKTTLGISNETYWASTSDRAWAADIVDFNDCGRYGTQKYAWKPKVLCIANNN